MASSEGRERQQINDGMRANWGLANVSQTITKELRPALRRAYSREAFGEANAEALDECVNAARRIVGTLEHVREILAQRSDA